jgi:cytochrome c-type biogenesis protein CcmH/NrfF
MRTRIIVFWQLVLILPTALFMAALVLRNVAPLQYEPAHTAQQIVMWYAGRLWTLWVLLFTLPCIVLVIGCVALRTRNRDTEQHSAPGSVASTRPHWLVRLLYVTTVASAGVLAIVVFHVLTH